MRCPTCGIDIGCICARVKPGDTMIVDADVYTGDVELENRLEEAAAGPIASGADDVMAYEATDGPLAGITILIERWNGKGFNSVCIEGGRALELGEFLLEYVKTQPATKHANKLVSVDAASRAPRISLSFFGKKKPIENLIVKGLIAWHALETKWRNFETYQTPDHQEPKK